MKRIVIATVIGLAALSAGCTSTGGQATPTPTTAGNTPTSDNSSSSDQKSIKPCDLLTDSEAAGFGMKLPGESAKIVAADACDWTIPGNGGVIAAVIADKGVKDLNLQGDKISEVKVGKFTATKVEAQDGSKDTCTIAIAITDKSSAMIVSSAKIASGDTAAACERAAKAADLIAPKLS